MAKQDKFDASKAVDMVKKDTKLMLLVGGAVALLIGMFLPWISVDLGDAGGLLGSSFNTSVNGIDANSFFPILLLAAAVAAGLNIGNQDKKNMLITSAAVSALAFVIVLIDWPNTGDTLGVASIGIGYYLSFVGSAVMLAGSGMLLKAYLDGEKKAPVKKEEK